MKKTTVFLLLVLLSALCACGDKRGTETRTAPERTVEKQAPAEAEGEAAAPEPLKVPEPPAAPEATPPAAPQPPATPKKQPAPTPPEPKEPLGLKVDTPEAPAGYPLALLERGDGYRILWESGEPPTLYIRDLPGDLLTAGKVRTMTLTDRPTIQEDLAVLSLGYGRAALAWYDRDSDDVLVAWLRADGGGIEHLIRVTSPAPVERLRPPLMIPLGPQGGLVLAWIATQNPGCEDCEETLVWGQRIPRPGEPVGKPSLLSASDCPKIVDPGLVRLGFERFGVSWRCPGDAAMWLQLHNDSARPSTEEPILLSTRVLSRPTSAGLLQLPEQGFAAWWQIPGRDERLCGTWLRFFDNEARPIRDELQLLPPGGDAPPEVMFSTTGTGVLARWMEPDAPVLKARFIPRQGWPGEVTDVPIGVQRLPARALFLLSGGPRAMAYTVHGQDRRPQRLMVLDKLPALAPGAGGEVSLVLPPPLIRTSCSSSDKPVHLRKGRKLRYDASAIIDGKLDTAWAEGQEGDGIGEWVELRFDRDLTISDLRVWNGYQKVRQDKYGDRFEINQRVARLSVDTGQGVPLQVTLRDHREPQLLSLANNQTRRLRLVVDSVYKAKYNDTALSEVQFQVAARPNELDDDCQAGDAASCGILAWNHWRGSGLPQDSARALLLAKRGCVQKAGWLCTLAGNLVLAGKPDPALRKEAIPLFTSGCEHGHQASCERLDELSPKPAARKWAPAGDEQNITSFGGAPAKVEGEVRRDSRAACRKTCKGAGKAHSRVKIAQWYCDWGGGSDESFYVCDVYYSCLCSD